MMTGTPPKTLDLHVKQDVRYAIPTWLRDEQIKLATARRIPRIAAIHEPQAEPIAVVCFGPSLNDTWEQLRGFAHVMSCSGSHKFLVERGIVPTWHVEVDPRPHKIELIGQPHNDVEYLIASTCHPKVFDWLDGFHVKLWHVFANEAEALRVLPPNEWALTGGCSVGLRTLTIARFFGFTDIHVFGMDGSEGDSGKHAAAHPMQPKGHSITTCCDREFRTTPSMLEAARGTWHELNQMPDVKATFYGDGLVQHMATHYAPKPIAKAKAIIGYTKPALISAEYAALNAQLHRENLAYGVGGGKHADTVVQLMERIGARSVLDYGCGKGYMGKALAEKGIPIWEYDPAIPGKDESPRPADIVVCTDVLEHIEPDRLPFVLDDLRRCVKQIGFFTIHTGAAVKSLADGRNAHLIQKPKRWWHRKLERFFVVGSIEQHGPELYVVVAPYATGGLRG